MFHEGGELLTEQGIHDFLIDSRAYHELVVIEGHNALNYLADHIEGLLLCKHLQQAASDKVEALAVADDTISDGVGQTHPLNLLSYFAAYRCVLVEVGFICERPRQVQPNLVQVLAWVDQLLCL